MSGGNAYQYDPDNLLREFYSEDSVILKSLNEEGEEALAHESIILTMLSQHASRTGSQIAKRILENWQTTKQHFKYATPLALYKTQTVEGILNSMDERMIVEELSFAVAKEELATVADAYKAGNALLNGDFPKYGQIDTPEMFKLINCYSHLAKAVDMARVQLKQSGSVNPNPQVDGLARSLIVNQDRKLLETIAKDVKTALQPFSAEELASKLMRKRINDYKTSMQERDIQDNNSLGTTAWILQQERHNVGVSQSYLKFEEHYAGKSIDKLL